MATLTRPEPADDRPAPGVLGARVRSGVAWKAAGQVTAQISRTAMTVVLAHLLAPGDFGLAALALVFTGLFQLLSDVGFSASMVQLEHLSDVDRSTAFWTGLGISGACFLVAFACASAVAGFYHQPRVKWMFVVVASGLVLSALSTTQAALLWRKMDFRALEIRGMLASVVSSIAGVSAAVAGLGAWSLIVAAISGTVVSTATIWAVSPWKPRFTYSFESLRRMGSFSLNVFLNRFAVYADHNVDNLLVGRYLGTVSLGIYSLGYSVIVIPFERVIAPVANVLIPAFASLQKDLVATRTLWLRGIRLIAALTCPAMAGVMIVAPDFVPVVLGRKWDAAAPIVQILAWVTLVQSLLVLNNAVYQSRFRTGLLLTLGLTALTLDTAAFVVGLHWGIRGVAGGYAVTNTVVIVPLGLYTVCRLLQIPIVTLAAELRGVFEATAVMSLLLIAIRRVLVLHGVPDSARLGAVIFTGALAYLAMCAWRERRLFTEFRLRRTLTSPPAQA